MAFPSSSFTFQWFPWYSVPLSLTLVSRYSLTVPLVSRFKSCPVISSACPGSKFWRPIIITKCSVDKVYYFFFRFLFKQRFCYYKGALVGIIVRDDISEERTSITCHACGRVMSCNRRHRGLYACSCGWRAQADVNGALNIYERAYKVSPVKGSSGRVARPAVVSYHLGWHGVAAPKYEGKPLCASA